MLIASIVLTLLFTSAIGYLSKFKVKSSSDFTSATKGLGVLGVTSILMGSIIGGATTVGTAQMAYTRGYEAIWFTLGLCTASILLSFVFSKVIDAKKSETIPQIIASTYGQHARIAASIMLSLGMFIHINGQIIACGSLFSTIFDFGVILSTLIVASLLIIYVVFGGFWGSTLVGAVKTILLYSTSIIAGLILVFKYNAPALIARSLPAEWFNVFGSGYVSNLASCFSTIVGVLSTQTYFQAVLAGKNSKVAKASGFITAFLVLQIGIVCTAIGMFMRINHPNILASQAFPLFMTTYFHPIFAGISLATILISSLATGAGLTLGIATMFTRDIYKMFINKAATDQMQMRFLRMIIMLVGSFAAIIVILNSNAMILNFGFISMVFRATPIFIPLLFALFGNRTIAPQYGIYGIVAGPLASILWIGVGLDEISSIYVGLITSLTYFIVLSLRSSEIKPKATNLKA